MPVSPDSTSSTLSDSAPASSTGEAVSGQAEFVVVANRLPVDLERLPDGTTRWKRSPGGLVTALEPILRSNQGAWVGWAGGGGRRARPHRRRRTRALPRAAERRGDQRVLRGILQRHPLAALSRRHRQTRVPPRMVERLRRGEPAIRRSHLQGSGTGRDSLDPGLPAAVGTEDAADAAPRPDHRLLPAHSVSPGRAVHADAVAHRDRRRPPRRRPHRLPPSGWRTELPVPGQTPCRATDFTWNRRRPLQTRCGASRFP